MLTATCTQMAHFFVGDVVTLKSGGPRMTITDIGPVKFADGDWLRCQWFDDHGELRQDLFSQDDVKREPRSISPGSVHLRSYASPIRSCF
ncbi:YodC family protein [Trinickia mobilis]|uniref:YodC family protein n=1 Tax=Trinickia mobilis TaxID=2816356 RepID=UPI001A8CAF6A|nr:YodC family protein [Trinickia mobilis]